MKKTTFILALLLFSIGWQANSQITTYPYSEDFEAGDGGWIADNGTDGTWALGLPAYTVINSAASGANSWVTNLTGDYNSSDNSFVTSPVFDLSTLTAPTVSFNIWWEAENSYDGAVFQSSIDGGTTWVNVGALGDPNNWYSDGTINGNPGGQQEGWSGRNGSGSNGWVNANHALLGLAGEANVIFRFAFGSDGSVQSEGFAFDDVTVFNTDCPSPSGLMADAITSDSVDLSWTLGAVETAWEVVVQTSGTGLPTGAGTSVSTNAAYTVGSLLPATDYEVYVRADCGGDFSVWAGPTTFTTACSVFVPDYFQDFTTIPAICWDVADSGDATTGPGDIGTSSWTQDGYLNNGTTGAYKINLWLAAKSDWLLSPLFDLTGVPFQVEFDFGVMPFGGTTVAGTLGSDDTVELMITTDSGATWTVLQTFDATSVIPDSGLHVVQDLTAYSGLTAQFGIRASEGVIDDAPDNDVFVDNFQVRAIPSCPDPLAIVATVTGDTTADITWDAGSTETEWQIWIQAAGTGTPTTDGVVTSSNAPYQATGLTPSTPYEVYVRGNCGTEGFSAWIGPVNFTTFNTPPPAPVGVTCASGGSTFIFTEDFGTDTGTDPSGWTGTGFDGSDGNWDITAENSNSGGTGPNVTWDGNAGMHLEYEASGSATDIASAISPAIDLTLAVDGAELSFFMHAFGADIGTLNVGISTSPTGPFTTEYSWIGDYQSTADEPWVPIGINLDAYLGQVIYIEYSYGGAGTGFEGDLSIDQIRVESCGVFCIAPTNINVSSITETSADISWTPSGTETEWNYVLQPAGTGVPTSGTAVSTTTIPETGLNAATDYEVYVQAICGSDSSTWAGPFNFSTLLQFDFVLDCATDGPQTIDYCYINNDTNVFTFSSTDGTPLNITFTAGQVESGWDELVVFDTDGVTDLNAATPYGNGGDVSGITYQSSGDTISFGVQSDGIFDCGSQGYTSISVTVTCATCVNPTATFVVVDDCANGDQFLVDVDVTSLGDATSVSIEDNQGNAPITIGVAGVTQFGPYTFNTDVSFTVSNLQDSNCIITSSTISLAACPPENDNPCDATVALVNNGESCIDVNSGTLIEATDSGLPGGSCGTGTDDDVWYQFTALGEQQIIQILNVAGGFNVDHALYEEGADCNDLTQLYCTTDDSSITPTLTVGNVYYIRVFSAGTTATTITFDLCIQTLGVPTYCTEALPICADPTIFYPSIVGDQVAPSYIDYDCLGSQPDPQWNTIQFDDAGDYVFQLAQTNDAGTGLDIDFIVWGPFPGQEAGCFELLPEAIADCSYSATATETITLTGVPTNSIYIILITNFSQQSGSYVFTQESGPLDGTNCDVVCEVALDYDGILIEQGLSAPEGSSDAINLCGNTSVTLTADTAYAVDSYDWYVNGIYQEGINSPTLVATETATYQCVVGGGICDDFTLSLLATINFYDSATADQALDMEVCDDGAGNGVFDLETQTVTILGTQDPSEFSVTYYSALSDAQAGTGALMSPYTATDGTTVYVRVEDVDAVGSNSGCASTNTTFSLVVSTSPEATQPMDMEVCDDGTGSNVFDLTGDETTTIGAQTGVVVTYHTNEADALSGDNAIATPTTYALTTNSETIYVRAENATASDCFATTSFGISYNPAPETTFNSDITFEVCPNATSPIIITAEAVNYSVSDVSIKWYYEGGEITGQTGIELPTVLLAGDYEIEVTFNDSGCTSSAFVTVEELETCIIPQGISPNGDGINDRFDLSSFDVQTLEIFNRNGTLVYSKNNYTSEWGGQSDNGDMLPVGTYYYVMKYQGTKTKAAWVYINK